jgi:hypothetical protein
LSQASQITGYHQDYLGLLCRLGKIEANKIGRNWYTTQSEINKFLNPETSLDQMGFTPETEGLISESATSTLQDILSEPEVKKESAPRAIPVSIDSVVISAPVVKRAVAPTIVENVVISDMESLPIRLVKKPAVAQHHTLQSLITRTKLEQLKQEVLEIAGFMDNVSSELAEHRAILQKHESMLAARKDLASSYASNIDFGLNQPAAPVTSSKINMLEDSSENYEDKKYVWLWPSLAISLVVVITLVALTGFMPKTVNYASTIYYKLVSSELNPQVAGETDTPQVPIVETQK